VVLFTREPLFLHASFSSFFVATNTMVNSLWFKWKSLRLPWRRSVLVGMCYCHSTSSC
jgi:hypothetical protein